MDPIISTPCNIDWKGLEATLDPSRVPQPITISSETAPSSTFPVVDCEPWRNRTFYDTSPYDFSAATSIWQPNPALVSFVHELPQDLIVLEIGCGMGRNVSLLSSTTSRLVVLDQSLEAAATVAQQHKVRAVRGSALSLPFHDRIFDAIVCDGVAHHTGDWERALAEAVRVLKPGGHLYAAIYRSGTPYEALYLTLGSMLRVLDRLKRTRLRRLATALDGAAFGLYRLASRVFKGRRATDPRALRNLFDDYFVTPIASFQTREEILRLFRELGCALSSPEPRNNVWIIRTTKSSVQ